MDTQMTETDEIELVTADETTQEFEIGEAPQGTSTLIVAMPLLLLQRVYLLCKHEDFGMLETWNAHMSLICCCCR